MRKFFLSAKILQNVTNTYSTWNGFICVPSPHDTIDEIINRGRNLAREHIENENPNITAGDNLEIVSFNIIEDGFTSTSKHILAEKIARKTVASILTPGNSGFNVDELVSNVCEIVLEEIF